jgi:hypothetical protein
MSSKCSSLELATNHVAVRLRPSTATIKASGPRDSTVTTSTTMTTIKAKLRTVALDLACYLLSRRVGPWESWAQVEATSSPYRVTRPGPGELVIDLASMSIALTNHRRRVPVRG